MAHIKLLTFQQELQGSHVFLIDEAVGQGCPNRRDDVLLVQFFLRTLANVTAGNATYQVPGRPPLIMDGACGPATIAGIKRFQDLLAGLGSTGPHAMRADGLVHPARGSILGAKHGNILTIVRMNMEYLYTFGKGMFLRLDSDPLFPTALRQKLYLTQ